MFVIGSCVFSKQSLVAAFGDRALNAGLGMLPRAMLYLISCLWQPCESGIIISLPTSRWGTERWRTLSSKVSELELNASLTDTCIQHTNYVLSHFTYAWAAFPHLMNSQAMDQPKALLRLLAFYSGQLLLLNKSPPNLAAHYNHLRMHMVPMGQEFGRDGAGWLTPAPWCLGSSMGRLEGLRGTQMAGTWNLLEASSLFGHGRVRLLTHSIAQGNMGKLQNLLWPRLRSHIPARLQLYWLSRPARFQGKRDKREILPTS